MKTAIIKIKFIQIENNINATASLQHCY